MRCLTALTFFSFIVSVFAVQIAPTIPSKDDFYKPPKGFESQPNGSILKLRKTPFPLRSVILKVDIEESWQILVRSEDSFGEPNAVVATIMKPYNADPSKMLSYQTAMDSSNPDCAPSYAFQYLASQDTISTEIEMLLIQPALKEGWYVVSPDYEGTKATFTAGRQSGYATLNSIRGALKSSNITGVNSDAKVVMWGYSGGTIATGWGAALQPEHAPELKGQLLGAAMGGMVTNITATAVGVEGTLFAGLTATALGGLCNEYLHLTTFIGEETTSEGPELLKTGQSVCLVGGIFEFMFRRYFTGLDKVFKRGWDVFQNPYVESVINNNTLALKKGDPMPEIPIFVFHGEIDTIVPFKDAQRAYTNWCDWGINSFEFAVDKTAGHITEIFQGSGAGFAWVKKMLEGGKAVQGCTRTVRETNNLYPGAVSSVGDILMTAVTSLFGVQIGPNGEGLQNHPEVVKRLQMRV